MTNPTPSTPAPHKVLVVDDSPDVHALVKARLKDQNYDLHFASGGVEGIATVARVCPDLILLDVDMPDLGGLDVIQRLKADSKAMATPVIFLTGENSGAAKARGFELGAVDYVTKPFEPVEFRARVKAALRTKELMDLLNQRAMIDGLTGLWNRRYFEERLAAETSLSERTNAPLSLVMMDVDHFKMLNDAHGHPFGDEVLRAIARAAASRVRVSDVLCRYGGEEFAALLPNTDADRALTLAEGLRAAVESLKLSKGKEPVPVTASFGVADRAPRQPPEALLQSSDGALYDAKRAGRNKVMSRHGVGGLARVA